MRLLYSLFMYLATPMVFGYFAVRGLRDARYRQRWGERLGFGADSPAGAILVHAASLGEVNAASPLVQALLDRAGGTPVLLTTFTPTGAHRAEELFGKRLTSCHLPLDLPGATRRFLERHEPSMLVIMETEIWPNLFHAAAARGLPLVIVNARLSEKSLRGYRRLGALIGPALGGVSRVLAQSRDDADRFAACGAKAEQIDVVGNLKFDVSIAASLKEAGELLRAGWDVARPVLVAGSTHAPDEAVLLASFTDILKVHPNALLVLAPRHPERFQDTAGAAREAGLEVHLHSSGGVPASGEQCLVVDAMGELLRYYAAADLAFVGGTIAPVGGHNLLEPAALGKPLLFGEHTANVREISRQLLESGAARQVLNREDLASTVCALLGDGAERDRMGQAGIGLVENGRGALERTLAAIQDVNRGFG